MERNANQLSLQILRELENDFLRGNILNERDELISVFEMQLRYNVSSTTIRNVLSIMRAREVLIDDPGKGYKIHTDAVTAIRNHRLTQLKYEFKKILDDAELLGMCWTRFNDIALEYACENGIEMT